MKKSTQKYTFVEVISSIMMITFNQLWSTIIIALFLFCTAIKSFIIGLEYYQKSLDELEITLQSITSYHPIMWMWDTIAFVLILIFFVYINEAIQYYTKKSLIDRILDNIKMDDN